MPPSLSDIPFALGYGLFEPTILESIQGLQTKKAYPVQSLAVIPCPHCGSLHLLNNPTSFNREPKDQVPRIMPCGQWAVVHFVANIDRHELERQRKICEDPKKYHKSRRVVKTLDQ